VSDSWTVSLVGLEIFGRHGVFDEERELGQRFVVDLDMELGPCRAGETDELADTIDYSSIADLVAEIVAGPAVDLLERLAARIADAVLERDRRITAATVHVHKPHVAIPYTIAEARVVLRRTRS
jgi:dihydroneopterin aldolase